MGEPVKPHEEVNDNEADEESSAMSEESNIDNDIFYEEPEELAESFADVENLIDEAFADVTESYGEEFMSDLPEDDYGIFDE